MIVQMFKRNVPDQAWETLQDAVRSEHVVITRDEHEYHIIVLDADDTIDVIIESPTGERECIWSLVKDPAEIEEADHDD